MVDVGADSLVESLREHNPWWDDGAPALAPTLPARRRSDYYHLARPEEDGSQFEDQPITALVGHNGVGKTTLLRQFVYDRIAGGEDPARFCYLPFDADPLYQLHSDEQLEQALRYYESRVLGRLDDTEPHFLLLDDVHRIEHRDKSGVEGWGTPVARAIDALPGRHVVVTASAERQVDCELDRVGVATGDYDVQPILPEKFRDYLFSLYPSLEEGDNRVSPTPIRTGDGSLPAALEADDPSVLLSTLRDQYDRVADSERRIQSQVVHYLALGGLLSYDQQGAIEDARDVDDAAYDHLADAVRASLYREVPGFESIKTVADLERLCALAAKTSGAEPIAYQRLVDLFGVDRRTIRDSYLTALQALYILTPITEYNNTRPRSVDLYLRDTGLLTAFSRQRGQDVLSDRDRETALARVAAFDHTMRFAYGVNALQGDDRWPAVAYWEGRDGTVDFVFEVDGTPVPVALAYQPPVDEKRAVLEEFLEHYDTPIGLLVTGDTVSTDGSVQLLDDRILQVPYWLYLVLC